MFGWFKKDFKLPEEPKKEVKEVKKESKVVKKPNPWPRPTHHPVCTCHKCIRWKEAENA